MHPNQFLVASLIVAFCGVGIANGQMMPQGKPVSYGYFQDASVEAEISGCAACPSVQESDSSESNCGCASCCDACDDANDSDEPWKLFGRNREEPVLNIGGWVSMGYTSQSTDLFNSNPDSFNLSQGWLYVEKAAESGECGELGWGFRFDGMYGVDADDTQAFGNAEDGFGVPTGWDNGFDNGIYGWALPQLYLELAKNDWSLKVGHFFTIIGYEVVTDPDNFFYSHAITMYNSEPFTHTGVLATWEANECTTVYAGWTAGWDTGFDQFDNGSNFLGGFSRKFNEDFTFTYTTTIGDFGARGSDGYMQSLLFQTQYTKKLSALLQSDYLRIDSTGEDNFGLNQYFFYDLSDRVKLGTRMEWWKGDSLTGYAPHGGVLPATGSHSYYEVTSGFNYRVNSNFVVRPEYRYDWSPALGYEESIFGIDFVATF